MTPPPRLPPRVYRRRRAGLLLALAVIVAGIVTLVSLEPWAGAFDSAPSATPTPSALQTLYPTTSPDSAPDAPPRCTAEAVSVTAVADASSYARGVDPQLSLSLTNTSSADCVINAGTGQQVFTISSGSDRIWTSTDCQTAAADLDVLLQAGSSVSGSALIWDRTRSSADTCSGGRESAAAGGAAYDLSVSVAGIASGSTTQFVLE